MSVTEQRYKAVLAVIGDGRTVSEVARDWGISPVEGDGSHTIRLQKHQWSHCGVDYASAGRVFMFEFFVGRPRDD
jgi:hypothetical protein